MLFLDLIRLASPKSVIRMLALFSRFICYFSIYLPVIIITSNLSFSYVLFWGTYWKNLRNGIDLSCVDSYATPRSGFIGFFGREFLRFFLLYCLSSWWSWIKSCWGEGDMWRSAVDGLVGFGGIRQLMSKVIDGLNGYRCGRWQWWLWANNKRKKKGHMGK